MAQRLQTPSQGHSASGSAQGHSWIEASPPLHFTFFIATDLGGFKISDV